MTADPRPPIRTGETRCPAKNGFVTAWDLGGKPREVQLRCDLPAGHAGEHRFGADLQSLVVRRIVVE